MATFKRLFFWSLLVLLLTFFACTRWEFERTEFFQVITIGTVEVQSNFAILIGDIANQKTATIVESGFVVSPVADDEAGLQVDKANTSKFPVREQDSLSTNQAFAVNARGLSPATTYYFRAYAQLEEVEEILYGEIDQFTTGTPVLSITSVSKTDPGCQTTIEVFVDAEDLDPTDPDVEFGLVWSNDLNNHYPNLDNGNISSTPGGSNSLLFEIACDQTYFVRLFAKPLNGTTIYSTVYAFTTLPGGLWQAKAAPSIRSRAHSFTFTIEEKGYLGGGVATATTGISSFGDLWLYNIENDNWELINPGDDLLFRQQNSLFVQDDKVYFVSGKRIPGSGVLGSAGRKCNFCPCRITGNSSIGYSAATCENYPDPMLIFNPTDNSWKPLESSSSLPLHQRRSAALLSIGNEIYWGGGQTINDRSGMVFNSLEDNCLEEDARTTHTDFYKLELNGSTINWTQQADIPGPINSRSDAVAFGIGGKGYVGLGYGLGELEPPPGQALHDFYQFDPIPGSWQAMADFPGGPTSEVSFSLINKGYVITGSDSTLETLWQFDPLAGSGGSWKMAAPIPSNSTLSQAQASFVIGSQAFVYFDFKTPSFWVYIPELD